MNESSIIVTDIYESKSAAISATMPAFQITVVELFTCPLMNKPGVNWIKVVWQKVFSWSGLRSFVVACQTAGSEEKNNVKITIYKLD